MIRAFGSPKTPRMVAGAQKPAKRYVSCKPGFAIEGGDREMKSAWHALMKCQHACLWHAGRWQ